MINDFIYVGPYSHRTWELNVPFVTPIRNKSHTSDVHLNITELLIDVCVNTIVGFILDVEINGAKNKLEQCYHYFTFLVKAERKRKVFYKFCKIRFFDWFESANLRECLYLCAKRWNFPNRDEEAVKAHLSCTSLDIDWSGGRASNQRAQAVKHAVTRALKELREEWNEGLFGQVLRTLIKTQRSIRSAYFWRWVETCVINVI